MNKTIKNISKQGGATIKTLNPNPVAQAFMLTTSPFSSNFNHITYFTIA
jgi:hypothetical protein